MALFDKVSKWGDEHHPKWIDYLRILTGLILLFKGISFLRDVSQVETVLLDSNFSAYAILIAHYVAVAHLVGGFLMVIGLLTRVASLIQLPVLIGAIIFVNVEKGFFTPDSELGFSLVIFFLLIFFFVYGSGTVFSADNWLRTHKET